MKTTFEKELISNGFQVTRYPNREGYLLLVDDNENRHPHDIENEINSISSKLGVQDRVILPQITRNTGIEVIFNQ